MRPARMWELAAAVAATPLIAMFVPAPVAGELARSSTRGSLRFPSTRPTRPPPRATRKHQRTRARYSTEDGSAVQDRRRRGSPRAYPRSPVTGAARGAYAPGLAGRLYRAGAPARGGVVPDYGDRDGQSPLDDPLRPAGDRQDDARPHRRRQLGRRLRGGERGRGGARGGPRGHGARLAPPAVD